MGEDFDVNYQFPFYLELGQKCKLVYGLSRSVIHCFLGSGVLTSRRQLYPEFCGNFYRGINIPNSGANNEPILWA